MNRYLPSVTQRHLGAWKVMWEMQQLARRAGALEIDLINVETTRKADEQVVIVSAWGWIREKMEDVRGPHRTGCPDLPAFY